MIITPESSLCYDLLAIQLDDGLLDLSWSLNADYLKSLIEAECTKILDFKNIVDFDIQIDTTNTFDSINLQTYNFSQIDKKYVGNIVYSVVIPFNKNKFEETQYYFRVKINSNSQAYTAMINGRQNVFTLNIEDVWTEPLQFTIRKNYTKDIIEIMYRTVADFNAYNKEAKSANFYYLFQAFATTLNQEFTYVQNLKENHFINKALPDDLKNSFGELFKFTNVYGLSMEEYRRILRTLIIGYQHGGAWNYIKEVLKYLIGYTPELFTLKNFYPWILRKAEIVGYYTDGKPIYNWNRQDPENFEDRNYYNADSNYYLYVKEYSESKDKNSVMLTTGNEKLFTFIVKTDNFFNIHIDEDKVKNILNILKSSYTKYSLNIEDYVEPISLDNDLLVNDNQYLLVNSSKTLKY